MIDDRENHASYIAIMYVDISCSSKTLKPGIVLLSLLLTEVLEKGGEITTIFFFTIPVMT